MNQRDNSDNNCFNNSSQDSADSCHFGLTLVDKTREGNASSHAKNETKSVFLKSVKRDNSKDIADKNNNDVVVYSNFDIKEQQSSEDSKVFQLHFKYRNQAVTILGYSIAITDEIALKTSYFARTFLAKEFSIGSPFDEESISKVLKKLNRRIFERGLEDARFSGSGLALAVVFKEDRVFKIANIGDVRAYVLLRKVNDNNQQVKDSIESYQLRLTSKDHTLTQELRDTRTFNEDDETEIKVSESDDILTRYIGKAPHVELGFNLIKETSSEKISKIILITNGIYKAVNEEDLLSALVQPHSQENLQELILKVHQRVEIKEYCKSVAVISNDNINFNQKEQSSDLDESEGFDYGDKPEEELKDFENEPAIEDLAVFSKVIDNEKKIVKTEKVATKESSDTVPANSPTEFITKVEEPHHRYAGEAVTEDEEEEFGGIHEVKIPVVLDPVIANSNIHNAIEAVSIDSVVENKNTMSKILSASATKYSDKNNITGGIYRPTELNYGSTNLKLGKSSSPQITKQPKNNRSLSFVMLTGISVGILAGILFAVLRFKDPLTNLISDKYRLVTAGIWKDANTETDSNNERKKVVSLATKDGRADNLETNAGRNWEEVELAMKDDSVQEVADDIYVDQLNKKAHKTNSYKEKLPEIELSSRSGLSNRDQGLKGAESPKISYDGYKLPIISKIDTITDPDLKLMFTDVIDAIKKSQDKSERRFISLAIKQEQIASRIEDLSMYVDRLAEIIDRKQVDLEQVEDLQK